MKLQDTHVKAVSGWPRTPPVQENPHRKLRQLAACKTLASQKGRLTQPQPERQTRRFRLIAQALLAIETAAERLRALTSKHAVRRVSGPDLSCLAGIASYSLLQQ